MICARRCIARTTAGPPSIRRYCSDVNEFLKLVDKYLDIPELDAAILNELVSRIVVHSPVRENGRKQVQIDLYFTYVGQIRIPLKIGRESLNESEPA